MSARLDLPGYAELDAATADFLAGDDSFGLTSVPSATRRGLLELRPPGGRQLAVLWPEEDFGHAAPAPSAELAAEWAGLAAIAPRGTMVEVAVGLLGHRELHWRLVDLVRLEGVDARSLGASARHQALLGIYRQALGLRLRHLELASLIAPGRAKAEYAAEGPGRTGDRLAFRRLDAAYGEPWLLAPVGWHASRGS